MLLVQACSCRNPHQSSLPINVGQEEISRSKQHGAEDESVHLTDDISVDISTLAAFQEAHQYVCLLLMDRQHFPPVLIFFLSFISLTQMSTEMRSCYLFFCLLTFPVTWTMHQSSHNICPSESLLFERMHCSRSDRRCYQIHY